MAADRAFAITTSAVQLLQFGVVEVSVSCVKYLLREPVAGALCKEVGIASFGAEGHRGHTPLLRVDSVVGISGECVYREYPYDSLV